jgi:mannose-1-phosphate guanylyltransferase/mannose-6-phosphate isomerase
LSATSTQAQAGSNITAVILCGGAGTRLWPLSRALHPKQFVPMLNGKSLLQATLERTAALTPSVMCLANQEYRFLVQEAMASSGMHGVQLLEPFARNTAAAMACAALNAKGDDLLLFTPADHHIPDARLFSETVRKGIAAARQGHIVTFGVVPIFPSTAYGYVEQGAPLDENAYVVSRFVEKPPAERARDMLSDGRYFWNAGIFLCQANVLLEALAVHAADILQSCKQAVASQVRDGQFVRLDDNAFAACRSESIDYAVLEKHGKVAMVPFAGAWSDVGSWNAVAQLTSDDGQGNRVVGQGVAVETVNTYINAPGRLVVALGTKDLFIVDTPDALLVAASSHAEQVKGVVEKLQAREAPQATSHRCVARPWGTYETVDLGDRFQVKRITVKPGAALSLQMHHHRAEHWVVVSGTARVTRGEDVFLLNENQSTYIPVGVQHRLENPGITPLEMIEVQSGSYLGEDDIVRFEDSYGRISVSTQGKH